ncbi:hypothetical protein ACIP4S_33505 [Streptomyces chartreusis]|uniref:hypothetical protein n=1 Tax=Streptomyces chartreusis TaxID=1969 RepID=UPI00381C64A1
MQKRLLTDHAAALGVMLVSRSDSRTAEHCAPGGGGTSKATRLGRPRSRTARSVV